MTCICFGSVVHTFGGDFDLPIPANQKDTHGWMEDAIIEINDHLNISDIDLAIEIEHTRVFDLQIFLVSPTGTRICLNMYNIGEDVNGPNYVGTIFDDEAELGIKEGKPPFTGRFRPLEPHKLSKFDGEDTFGNWYLQVYDFFASDKGRLQSFELMITAPEPATGVLFSTGIFVIWFSRRWAL